jgi:hypothetical protein
MITKEKSIKELMIIPGIGKSIADDLWRIGIEKVDDLRNRNPEELYDLSNQVAGVIQDRCLLYTFRCAVYFAKTAKQKQDPAKLKWWNWKDKDRKKSSLKVKT